MKKKLWSLLAIMMAAMVGFNLSSCGDDEDNGPVTPQLKEVEYYENDSDEDYTPLLVGTWYYMETGDAVSNNVRYDRVSIFLLTLNSDGTWSTTNKHRISRDNYVETIPGSDIDGTFTLESNNIVATYSKTGNVCAIWNFSPAALRQGTLKIMVKDDYLIDEEVERMDYQRFNYASPDAALDQYIAEHHLRK